LRREIPGKPASDRAFGLGGGGGFPYNEGTGCRETRPPRERDDVKKNQLMLLAMLTAGAATFLFAILRRREAAPVIVYTRPQGGEREGEFELFIGS